MKQLNVLIKRLFSLILVFCITFTSVPENVFANEVSNLNNETEIVLQDSDELSVSSDSEDSSYVETESNAIEDTNSETEIYGEEVSKNNVEISQVAYEEADKQDLSSKELLVKCNDTDIVKEDAVAGHYDDVYLMQYETEDDARKAYAYYYDNLSDKNEFVAPNVMFSVADDEFVTKEDAVEVEANTTPLDELSDAVDMVKPVETTAQNSVIALVDTGVSTSDHIIDAVSMLGDETMDGNGHGDKMVEAILSINPDANIVSIKAMDDKGNGNAASIYAAIEYAIEKNVKIINLSLSGRYTENNAAIVSAIKDAVDAGIIVVGAAGNNNKDVKDYLPGNIDEIYVVGACDGKGEKCNFSNYGDTVDYNFVAGSTSEAAAKFSAFISKNGVDGIAEALNKDLIFETTYMHVEEVTEEGDNTTDADSTEDGFKTNGTGLTVDLDETGVQKISGYDLCLDSAKLKWDNITNYNSSFTKTDFNLDNDDKSICYSLNQFWNNSAKYVIDGENWRYTNDGDISFDLPEAVKTSDPNVKYDLHVNIDNIYICADDYAINNYPESECYLLHEFYDDGGINFATYHTDVKIYFEVELNVTRKDDNNDVVKVDGKKIGIAFKDLDQAGMRIVNGEAVGSYGDTWNSGTEGIIVKSGVSKAFVENSENRLLKIKSELWGNSNNAFYGTKIDSSTDCSSVSFLADSESFKFAWTGKDCGTELAGLEKQSWKTYNVKVYGRYQKEDATYPAYENCYILNEEPMDYTFTSGQNVSIYVNREETNIYSASTIVHGPSTGGFSPSGIVGDEPTKEDSGFSLTRENLSTNLIWYLDIPRKSYTYSFDYNLPSGKTMSDVGNKQSDITKLAENTCGNALEPSLYGYEFLGWFEKKNGGPNGDSYDPTQIMISDKTYVAKWKPVIFDLSIEKEVKGNAGNKTTPFTFELTLSGDESVNTPDSLNYTMYYDGQEIKTDVLTKADGKFTFQLSHGQKIVISDVFYGTTYKVVETNGASQGYDVTYTNAEGTIAADTAVKILNSKQMSVPTNADTNRNLMLMLASISFLGLILLFLKRRSILN